MFTLQQNGQDLTISWLEDGALDHRIYISNKEGQYILAQVMKSHNNSYLFTPDLKTFWVRVYADFTAGPLLVGQQQVTMETPVPPPLPAILGSDAWMALFPKDADGFTIFPITTVVTIGSQPGDFKDLKTAQAAAQKSNIHTILFRRGETFTPAQLNDSIQTNGKGAGAPYIVSATNDVQNPRPILLAPLGVGNAHQATQYVVISSLDFYDKAADQTLPGYVKGTKPAYEAGIRMVDSVKGGTHIWIEDVRVRWFQGGIEIQDDSGAPFQTAIVNRCVVDHCHTLRFGLYTNCIQDLLIKDSVLDHNGWDDGGLTPKNIYSHNMYLQSWPATGFPADPQTRVMGCLIARAAAEGCEQRTGGLNDGCAYIGNPIAGFLGSLPNCVISNAVVDGAGFDLSIGTAGTRGWGLFTDATPSALMKRVICIDKNDKKNTGPALMCQSNSTDGSPDSQTALTLNGCIVHNWNGTSFSSSGTPKPPVFTNCDLPGVSQPNPVPTYVDNTRCLDSYCHVVNATTVVDFLAAACLNRRGAWHQDLTAAAFNEYIFEGFVTK